MRLSEEILFSCALFSVVIFFRFHYEDSLYLPNLQKKITNFTTNNNGSLGSKYDEERSEGRNVLRIARVMWGIKFLNALHWGLTPSVVASERLIFVSKKRNFYAGFEVVFLPGLLPLDIKKNFLIHSFRRV